MITTMVTKLEKKVVVMIDEVDKSSNNQVFVAFLAMLRNKYLERADIPTFYSVVLAGLHNVKILKLRLVFNAKICKYCTEYFFNAHIVVKLWCTYFTTFF